MLLSLSTATQTRGQRGRRGATNRATIAVIAILLLAGGLGAAFMLMRGDDQPAAAPAPVVTPAPSATPAPTPTPEPTPKPGPFALDAGPVEEAPPAVSVFQVEAVPGEEWTFVIEPTIVDLRGNPIFGGQLELQTLDEAGARTETFMLSGDEPSDVVLARWPHSIAIGGMAQGALTARAVFQMPVDELLVGPLTVEAVAGFEDPDESMLERAAQVSQATGRGGMGRFARQRNIEVMFSSDTQRTRVTRFDMDMPTKWEDAGEERSPRTLRIGLEVQVVRFGRIEATLKQGVEMPEGAVLGEVIDAETGRIIASTEQGDSEDAVERAFQRNLRAKDPIHRATLDRPMRGRRPNNDEEAPAGVRAELNAGSEPMAYRLVQRQSVMEMTPVFDGDQVVFPTVPPGRYQLEVITADGLVGRTEPFLVEEAETAKVDVELKDSTKLVVRTITKEGSDIAAVEGVRVSIREAGGGWGRGGGGRGGSQSSITYSADGGRGEPTGRNASEITDADGYATLAALEPGRYEVIADKDGLPQKREEIALQRGDNEIVIEMYRELAKLEFRVVSTDGYEVPEGTVTASRDRQFFGRNRRGIDAEVRFGRAEMELEYGSWVFAANAPNFAQTTLSQMEITDPGPHEVVISLPPQLDVTLRMRRRGQPMSGTAVTLFSRSESTFGPNIATTDEGGIATYLAAPGEYAVYVNNRFLDTVLVEMDKDNTFDLEMRPISVDGYLRDETDDSGIDRARVRLVAEIDPNDPSYTVPSVFRDPRARTNEEGYYNFNDVDEGSYRLEVTADGYASLITDPMDLNAETTGSPMTHTLSPVKGTIEGIISRPDGTPVAQIFVRQALNEEGVPYPINFREVMSNGSGRYRMTGLEPGFYILIFSGMPWTGANYLPYTTDVIEIVDETPVEYNVTIEPGGSVRFSLRDEEGVAVPNVRLNLIDGSGNRVMTAFVDNPDPVSDAAGEFHWQELAPGEYRVEPSRNGWTPLDPDQRITVEADRTIRATVVMQRTGE